MQSVRLDDSVQASGQLATRPLTDFEPPVAEPMTTWRRLCSRAGRLARAACGADLGTEGRWYPVLKPDVPAAVGSASEARELAEQYVPEFSATHTERVDEFQYRLGRVFAEVWGATPETQGEISVVYAVCAANERHPVAWQRRLYDAVRPSLYGSLQDVEAIVVGVDAKTLEPKRLTFEAPRDPADYQAYGFGKLHRRTEYVREGESWFRAGTIEEVPNPFDGPDGRPRITCTTWNCSLNSTADLEAAGFVASETPGAERVIYDVGIQPQFTWLTPEAYQEMNMSLRVGMLNPGRMARRQAWDAAQAAA